VNHTKQRKRGRWIKAGSAFGSAALITVTFVGSSTPTMAATTHTSPFSKYTIAYANSSEAGTVFVTIRQGMQAAAKKLGIKLPLYENNGDGPTALTNARLMVNQHPSLIVEYNLIQGVGNSLGSLIASSHTPCISVNVSTPGCPLINLSNEISGIGAGKIVGEIAKKRGWTAKNTTVLSVACPTCGQDLENSSAYFYLTIARTLGMPMVKRSQITGNTSHIGDFVQVADPDFSIATAYNNTKSALETIPSNQHLLVFGINDDTSLGAWRAIQAAGRGKQTLVAGLSGLPEGLQQVRTNPSWVAEGSLFLQNWGEYVLAEAVAVLKGIHPPSLTPLPQITMDKKTVNTYYPHGVTVAKLLPPIVSGNQYLLKSGVLQAYGNVQGVGKG
jgi:ribose transport system substrate-binding protein